MTAAPLRVLLVEDDDHTRGALRLALEGWGHSVEEADDGLDGAAKALAWGPDVVLVDLDMPVLDGYGLARRLRNALGQSVRLIALTGHDDRERALAAGFDEHLLKPADPERLRRLVATPADG
jgi:CheY-like chemotaxis protein